MTDTIRFAKERIRELREQRGWSQRELGRRSSIHAAYIQKYEAGTVEPSAVNLGNIAEALDVSADYLLNRTDRQNMLINNDVLKDDEISIIKRFREEGWPGVFKLGAERIAK